MRFSRTLHLAELNFKSSSILVLRQISFITDLIDADLPAGGGYTTCLLRNGSSHAIASTRLAKDAKTRANKLWILGPGARCISKARRKGTIHRCHTSSWFPWAFRRAIGMGTDALAWRCRTV